MSGTNRAPKGWTHACLADVVQAARKITYGIVQPGLYVEDGVPLVRGGDYSAGWANLDQIKRVTAEIDAPYKRSRIAGGDLLLTIVGANTGTVARVPDYLAGANITQTTARIAVNESTADPRFILHYLQSPAGEGEVRRYIKGGAQPGLNIEDVEQFRIVLPPLFEQRRIADALAAWDRAIEAAAGLVTTKRQLYDAVRQRLIDDHQRNVGVEDGWRSAEFGELAEELAERNRGRLGASSVMGVLKSQGIVPMREHVMANDLHRYLVVPPGAFAYNPMRLNIGSIAQSAHPSDILVSPDYVVFRARAGNGSAAFLRHFIGSKRWRDTMQLAASGSVRLRIYFDGLAEMTLRAPSLDRQEHIAKVLDAAQTEISLANRRLESLRVQKRGVVHKLLTGEWRLQKSKAKDAA